MTVVLPVVAMLSLSSYLIIEERNQLNQFEVLSAPAIIGFDLIGVVHQLQKECGRSAGFHCEWRRNIRRRATHAKP